jgi:hypothetical protein
MSRTPMDWMSHLRHGNSRLEHTKLQKVHGYAQQQHDNITSDL